MTSIGYKKLSNNWIAKLEILGDTNENRKDIVDKTYAKYRTSEAKVLKIFKKSGESTEVSTEETNESISGLHDPNFKYKTGEIVKPDNFDPDLEKVCSSGIHYFKTYEQAYMWELYFSNYTGKYKWWYENGQLEQENEYVNGEKYGLCKKWDENGQLYEECEYMDGEKHGLYKEWRYGQLYMECEYFNEERHGPYKRWHANGQLREECEYMDGACHGPYKSWHDNGQLETESEYINGELHGPYKRWYENGQLKVEYEYVNGKRHGIHRSWYNNGQLMEECE